MINESLRVDDLRNLVKKVFEIDNYKSKIGRDEDVVTLSFTVEQDDAAKDLENFFEMGYSFILDADCTPGETDNGDYKVFVEMERNRHIAENIYEIVEGVIKLTGMDSLRFRYFKNFKSHEATLKNLQDLVPSNKVDYQAAAERNKMDNFKEFFSRSYANDIKLLDESISFKRQYSGTTTFDIINSGTKQEVYNSIKGPIVLEGKDMAEVMFLTKTIGNYNINKIGNTFVFENGSWAVALKRIA